jgi:hypothetical protein
MCELNAIELIWAQLKKIFSNHNLNNNPKEINHLILKSLDSMDAKFWKDCINYCKIFEGKYWIIDGMTDIATQNLITNFGEDSETDEYYSNF